MTSLDPSVRLARRGLLWLALALTGCRQGGGAAPELVFGKRGINGGEFVKPRAIAIDSKDHIFVVDWTARIQGLDRDGKFLGHMWTPPDYRNGRPSGLSVDKDDNLIVSDSHYHCVRIYTPEGKLLRTVGGKAGTEPGELSYVSDALRDDSGNFYLSEFGENQRITKLDPDGNFLKCWGSPGSEPGQFARIRAMALGPDGLLYIADACNHRIQVFTTEGDLVRIWGTQGKEPGQLSYPYDVAFSPGPDPKLYVVEFGNHRVQKFTLDGKSLGVWGSSGREPGQLSAPWALCVDSRGRVLVVDSDNDRIQRIDF